MKFHAKNLHERLLRNLDEQLKQRQNRLIQLARDLHTLSPLNTLNRGYAIVSLTEDGRILHDAMETHPGDRTRIRLARGQLICEVLSVHQD